jgi:hypothetical protein
VGTASLTETNPLRPQFNKTDHKLAGWEPRPPTMKQQMK